jgi:hypothetical protein
MPLTAALLFGSVGSLDWPFAWRYAAFYLAVTLIGALVLPLEVIAERGSKEANTQKWDTARQIAATLGYRFMAGMVHVARRAHRGYPGSCLTPP